MSNLPSRWDFNTTLAAIGTVTGVVALLIAAASFLSEKSAEVSAVLEPAPIAIPINLPESIGSGSHDYENLLMKKLSTESKFITLRIGTKDSNVDIADLADLLAEDFGKKAARLVPFESRLPNGSVHVRLTNAGELPARNVRLYVPGAVLYLKGSLRDVVPVAHTDKGVVFGEVLQNEIVELFVLTDNGALYEHDYCYWVCEVSLVHEGGVGTVTVQSPGTLAQKINMQSGWYKLAAFILVWFGFTSLVRQSFAVVVQLSRDSRGAEVSVPDTKPTDQSEG